MSNHLQMVQRWLKYFFNVPISENVQMFPKPFQTNCDQSAKSLKLENTLVSLKTQIPANTEVKTQCHRNRIHEIPSILEHSQLIKSAESQRIPISNAVSQKHHPMNYYCTKWRCTTANPSVHREEARRSNTICSHPPFCCCWPSPCSHLAHHCPLLCLCVFFCCVRWLRTTDCCRSHQDSGSTWTVLQFCRLFSNGPVTVHVKHCFTVAAAGRWVSQCFCWLSVLWQNYSHRPPGTVFCLPSDELSFHLLASAHFFFPSNAVWLPPGRSTCFQACCIWD